MDDGKFVIMLFIFAIFLGIGWGFSFAWGAVISLLLAALCREDEKNEILEKRLRSYKHAQSERLIKTCMEVDDDDDR